MREHWDFFASNRTKSILGGIALKNIKIPIFLLVFLLALVGCQNPQNQGQIEPDKTDNMATATTQIEAEATENDFSLKLYADNSVYSTDETIKIWASLEYVGNLNSITIWHGDPYIVFSITDGAGFNSSGFINDILTSTELKKGELYHFDYVKSGVWDTQGPDADFWENFYQEEELELPAGTYTISVDGAFYLSEDILSAEKGPSCELQITVQ